MQNLSQANHYLSKSGIGERETAITTDGIPLKSKDLSSKEGILATTSQSIMVAPTSIFNASTEIRKEGKFGVTNGTESVCSLIQPSI